MEQTNVCRNSSLFLQILLSRKLSSLLPRYFMIHYFQYMKSVRIQSYSGPYFLVFFRTEYGEIRGIEYREIQTLCSVYYLLILSFFPKRSLFPQNIRTRKIGKISVFQAVTQFITGMASILYFVFAVFDGNVASCFITIHCM